MTEITLRKAVLEDSRNIWLWRNDPETRANSKNSDPIEWPDHERWFVKVLQDPQCAQYLVCGPDEDLGVVRFDSTAKQRFEVNINLAPQARGRGIGKAALAEGCRKTLAERPETAGIDATVKESNPQSLKLFLSCGFHEVGRADGLIKLSLKSG